MTPKVLYLATHPRTGDLDMNTARGHRMFESDMAYRLVGGDEDQVVEALRHSVEELTAKVSVLSRHVDTLLEEDKE